MREHGGGGGALCRPLRHGFAVPPPPLRKGGEGALSGYCLGGLRLTHRLNRAVQNL